jgi:hypothetical protein
VPVTNSATLLFQSCVTTSLHRGHPMCHHFPHPSSSRSAPPSACWRPWWRPWSETCRRRRRRKAARACPRSAPLVAACRSAHVESCSPCFSLCLHDSPFVWPLGYELGLPVSWACPVGHYHYSCCPCFTTGSRMWVPARLLPVSVRHHCWPCAATHLGRWPASCVPPFKASPDATLALFTISQAQEAGLQWRLGLLSSAGFRAGASLAPFRPAVVRIVTALAQAPSQASGAGASLHLFALND